VSPVSLLKIDDIILDRVTLTVTKSEQPIHLLPKEFALLEVLMRNQGRTMRVDSLLDQIWGTKTDVAADTLRSNIKTLRRKIDTPGQSSLIVTVHGIGYRIEASSIQ
jgi:two-component system OmpR family response regulator